MVSVDPEFTGRLRECRSCECPIVMVKGRFRATNPGDRIVQTESVVKGTTMVTLTPHHALCRFSGS